MRRAIFPIILSLLLFSGACTKHNQSQKDRLVVAIGAQPASLDPRMATDAYGSRITNLVFNSLVRVNSKLQVEGDAAATWRELKNNLEFQLRPNIRFSNGRPLNSSDIRFSFAEYTKSSSPFGSALNLIRDVEVQGSNKAGFQISISLNDYSAKFLSVDLPSIKLLPEKEILEKPEDFKRLPFGSGSYKILQHTSQSIQLAKNSYNNFNVPQIHELEFKIIKDDFTRFQKTLNGEIDIAQDEIPLEKVKSFEQKENKFLVYKYPGLAFTYILLNLRDPLLKKLNIRKALAHGINRQEIIDFKLEGYGQLATSIITPTNPFYEKSIPPIPYSPTTTAKMLKNIDPLPLKFELKTSSSPAAVDVAKVIKNQLSKLNINLAIKSFEWGTFYGDVKKGNFQMATMRWVGVLDPDIYRASLHSKETPPGRNRGHYKNQRFDEIVTAGLKERDPSKRFAKYREAQRIIIEDLPIIPLWYNHQVAIINKRVKNYEPSMKGDYWPFIKVTKN